MKFVTLGSCIAGDCIVKNKNLGWSGKNYVSYSPTAILLGEYNDVNIPESILANELPSQIERIKNDYSGHIFEQIKNEKADYILVDLSDFRINYKIIEFENGKKLIVTNRTLQDKTQNLINEFLEAKFKSKIASEKIIGLSNTSDEDLESHVQSFINRLYKLFGRNKVVFFKPRLANQYIDGKNIEYTPNFTVVGNINSTIDKIYHIVEKYTEYIDAPPKIIGDKSCLAPFSFHFSMEYYTYLAECINDFIKKGKFDTSFMTERLTRCEREIHRLYNRVFCNQILDRIKTKLDKDIVLIAKTKQFAEMLKERYNKEIFSYIEYNEDADLKNIENKLNNLKNYKNKLLFIIPEYFRTNGDKGLFTILTNLNYSIGYDVIYTIIKKENLISFQGVYEDIYGNLFNLKSKHNIVIDGFANTIKVGTNQFSCRIHVKTGGYFEIGDNGKINNALFRNFLDSYMKIGNNCNFGGNCDIACHSFSKIIIGNNVLMSVNEMIYAHDGHAIFQKDGDSYKCINIIKKPIMIGDHVWIGYRCHILSGTDIGDGSIVGAGSLVNKKFPNNVIVAGNPAKVIKKNIAWSGDPNIRDLRLDKLTFENWAHETIED